jgi:aspartate kinase
MGGFIGATKSGVTTTIGRGGSDYSAAIIGAELSAERIEIWTDVDGMMTTDPNLCSDARRIKVISFDEAAELAYFGAKVLHPATVLPAIQKNIPVYVLNSRNPECEGTRIAARVPHCRNFFKAIAAKKRITIIDVAAPRMLLAHGFMRAIFEAIHVRGQRLVNRRLQRIDSGAGCRSGPAGGREIRRAQGDRLRGR